MYFFLGGLVSQPFAHALILAIVVWPGGKSEDERQIASPMARAA
jgi:hypothetical protein